MNIHSFNQNEVIIIIIIEYGDNLTCYFLDYFNLLSPCWLGLFIYLNFVLCVFFVVFVVIDVIFNVIFYVFFLMFISLALFHWITFLFLRRSSGPLGNPLKREKEKGTVIKIYLRTFAKDIE